jgi:hypothetical protein
MGFKLSLAALLLATPALAQPACPPGAVPASASINTQLKGQLGAWSGGCVMAKDCRKAIPRFYRADMGWAHVNYSCGR